MSEHKSLAAALLAFHKNPPHIALDSTNPHFRSKFASLAGVMSAVRPRLAEEGLVLVQTLTHVDGAPAITTRLEHATGEFIEGTTPLLLGGKTDPQSHGSAITYARRYGALSITCLVGDEDDDGNAATTNGKAAQEAGAKTPPRSNVAKPPPPPPTDEPEFAPDLPAAEPQEAFPTPGDGITDKQLKFLKTLAGKLVKSEDDPLDVDAFRAELDGKYGVTATSALTKKQATEVIESLKERALAAGLIEERA